MSKLEDVLISQMSVLFYLADSHTQEANNKITFSW